MIGHPEFDHEVYQSQRPTAERQNAEANVAQLVQGALLALKSGEDSPEAVAELAQKTAKRIVALYGEAELARSR